MRVEPARAADFRKYENRRLTPSFGDILLEMHKKEMQRKLPALNL